MDEKKQKYTVQYIEKSWIDMREIGEEYYSMYEYTV